MQGLFSDEGDMVGKPLPYAAPSDVDVPRCIDRLVRMIFGQNAAFHVLKVTKTKTKSQHVSSRPPSGAAGRPGPVGRFLFSGSASSDFPYQSHLSNFVMIIITGTEILYNLSLSKTNPYINSTLLLLQYVRLEGLESKDRIIIDLIPS